jgi:hypothetical protein
MSQPSLRTGRETFASSGSPEKEMSFDSTVPCPYGAPGASRAQPASMPPGAPGAVSSFLPPLLAVLHPVQDMTSWHVAPTLPPPACPHAGMCTSAAEVRGERRAPVPGHPTSRAPLRCLLSTGCLGHHGPTEAPCRDPAPSHCGSGGAATCTCALARSGRTGCLRQQRQQVWSVNPSVAESRRTFVPGLPTLTSATHERRPGGPYTVVHV